MIKKYTPILVSNSLSVTQLKRVAIQLIPDYRGSLVKLDDHKKDKESFTASARATLQNSSLALDAIATSYTLLEYKYKSMEASHKVLAKKVEDLSNRNRQLKHKLRRFKK